ncbi:hypothetical protein L581_3955 [Serratia fonticola AU-AP2C]|nr:hypothetical protein L581_3955 [Serratia fonticola AU-AP2C]
MWDFAASGGRICLRSTQVIAGLASGVWREQVRLVKCVQVDQLGNH